MNYLQYLASDTEIKVSKLSRLLLFSSMQRCSYEEVMKRCSSPLHWDTATQQKGFQPRRAGIDSGSSNVGFVVDKVVLRHVLSEYSGFRCQAFHRLLHTHHHQSTGDGTIEVIASVIMGSIKLQPNKRFFSVSHELSINVSYISY
jgi:hypothetical protein